jgi:hypothetical protein
MLLISKSLGAKRMKRSMPKMAARWVATTVLVIVTLPLMCIMIMLMYGVVSELFKWLFVR